MDKSKPSREHNLVEWARPLLNNNKKLLRILDPRVEGQYSVKTAMKVANLAYQCLSQNPKGRPLMNHVVEVLESFQSKEECQEQMMSGCGSVTLFDVSKETEKHRTLRSESERKEVESRRPALRETKSQPPKELDLYNHSPDLECHAKSASSRS